MSAVTHCFITGGAGFIGSHLARGAVARGLEVTVFDNLSRRGSRENLDLLRGDFPAIRFTEGDVREAREVLAALSTMPRGGRTVVFHEASQVAVTTSVANPRLDFEINALGTFNVLEAVRAFDRTAPFFFASTNKVYGGLEDLGIELDARAQEYRYTDCAAGVGEDQPLDFHSPYGCSKGAADQYTRDYARIYGMRTVVFRQSCIYGTHQFGIEDQGWVAWFAIAQVLGRAVSIFGDGFQVRDVLWIGDLVDAYFAALERIDVCAGKVFNIGGGPEFRLTLRQLVALLERESGRAMNPRMSDWRPGDQRVFLSNITRAREVLGWQPRVAPAEGVSRLLKWARENRGVLEKILT